MRLYLVPCNALANGNLVAEDQGMIAVHRLTMDSNESSEAMKVYGALPGGVNGLGAMSVPQLAEARTLIEAVTGGDSMTRIHLAERDPQHHAWPKRGADRLELRLKILLSYWYYKDTDLDALFARYFTKPYPEVFADSGAFTAMTQGVTIQPEDYAKWIHKHKHLFTVYANLDVIKNAEATWENQQRFEQQYNLAPLPVFHVLEDWSYLDRYIERYPYIALGVAGTRSQVYMPWLVQCFKRTKGKAVYHGFGITSWEPLKAFPWYSVDSSSWGQGFRFGNVPIFDVRQGKFLKISLGDYKSCYKSASLIRSYGFDPADFAERKRNDRAKICAISALAYMRAEQWLRQRHGDIYIPNRPNAPSGPKVHLVDSPHTPLRDTGYAAQGIEETGKHAGLRAYLSDTSNGINYHDAEIGIKIHLASDQMGMTAHRRAADGLSTYALGGSKVNLATSQAHGDLSDITKVQQGLDQYKEI